MLSASAILRISGLLVVAVCFAALVRYVLPNPAAAPETPATVQPAATPALRSGDGIPAPQAGSPSPSTPAAGLAAPRPPETGDAVPVAGAPRRDTRSDPIELSLPRLSDAMEEAPAEGAAGPRALMLVDLNTGSVAELNALRGGGSIGRAIVQRRPYATVDQLLSKRVLSRTTFDRIRDQVTVR